MEPPGRLELPVPGS